MKRSITVAVLMGALISTLLWTADVWARAGRGGSVGSRGSRSYSAPVKPSPSPVSPSRPAAPPSSVQPPAPQRPGWMGGVMGAMGGLLLGGLIGSMLFGGLGHGLFGGIGLVELLLVGALAYFALRWFRRRQEPMPVAARGYGSQTAGLGGWQPESVSRSAATLEAPAGPSDLDRGLAHIRQMDPGFDPARIAEAASDVFVKIQAAWMARDMGGVRDLVTPEMHATLQQECDRLRADRRVNRLEQIAVRSVEATEAWQETGRDFVTVRFLSSALDYTMDEGSGQVVEGSRSEPVGFEEYWTFVRPVGPNPWRLTAIQQAG